MGPIDSIGIAMVKNEADIVEAFVRHNLAFLDVLVVIDNASIDGTREILVQLQRDGSNIVIFDDPVVGYFQAQKLTEAYRRVVPLMRPRYVFLLDADEFIVAPSRARLFDQLAVMRPGTQAVYQWRTYVPSPTDPDCHGGDPLRSITHRRTAERPWRKSIVVTDPHLDATVQVCQGAHDVTVNGRSLRATELADVHLAHFPVRSVDQITAKAVVGWIAYRERNRHIASDHGGHQWKTLYERVVHGEGISPEDLTSVAVDYGQNLGGCENSWGTDVVLDPVCPAYSELTVPTTTSSTTLRKVLMSVDGIYNAQCRLHIDGVAQRIVPESMQGGGTLSRVLSGRRPETAFEDDWHRRNLLVDLPPFQHIWDRYRPGSVLDIGCGAGAYLRYFEAEGASLVTGVDGIVSQSSFLGPQQYRQVDLANPLTLNTEFDLVICVEVIEHLSEEFEDVLLDSIVEHARGRIVFSGARVGQPGIGHINCRPITHWLDKFARRGWRTHVIDTLAMRSLATFSWFRSNLVVLEPAGTVGDDAGVRDHLAALELCDIDWEYQPPGVITHPIDSNLVQAAAPTRANRAGRVMRQLLRRA